MQRELYGVGSLVGREKFGLGSSLKKFVRKIIPNEVAEVAVKAAPFVAPFNPLLAGSMSALGTFDQSGSIGRSVKSGLINYGLGQGARYLGGAGFQEGFNPFAGGNYGFSSPLGTDTGIGKLLADKGYIGQTTGPQTFDDKFTSIEDVLYETSPDKLSTAQKAGIAFDKNVAKTATPGFKESVSKILSGDFTTMGEGLKELGGQGLKAIYTKPVPGSPGQTQIDKLALGATIAGVVSYAEARKLAKEADLVTDEDEYTEEMYEADRARYKEYYSDILTPESFGLKDGGRVKYADGTAPAGTFTLQDYVNLLNAKDDFDRLYDKGEKVVGEAGEFVKKIGDKEYDKLSKKELAEEKEIENKLNELENKFIKSEEDYLKKARDLPEDEETMGAYARKIIDDLNKRDEKLDELAGIAGLKNGGRVKYGQGGLSKNRIAQLMSLLESGEIDEDYKKQIKEEIDQLMGKYKSGGRVKFLKGGDTEYNAMVTEMYIKAGGQEGTGMDIDTFAETYFSKFAKGGRVKLGVGGVPSITLQEKEEIVEPDASMMMDTTTSNPIPENAAELAAAEIAKVIMGTRGIPGEETKGVMSSTEFIFNEYVMPKRKQLMENYGLTLGEADDLIRSAMDKYKKADGGRIELKFGSEPKEGIESLKEDIMPDLINRPDDAEEKVDELDDLMAGGGISFSRQEKSYLFRKLGGAGGSSRSYTMPQLYGILNNPNSPSNINDAKVLKEIAIIGLGGVSKKDGGRIPYAMGSEVPVRQNQGGITELDYRNTGGFVPIGVKEKADDVPAMLSKNEFVFTADAVRNAGGGDINKGAQKMYNLMKSLENKVVV